MCSGGKRGSPSSIPTTRSLSAIPTLISAPDNGQFLSAGKKLLDTKHPAFRAVTAVRHRIVSTWHSMTLPFPEPGQRLIRQDDVEAFDGRMTGLREELDEAVWRLDEQCVSHGRVACAALVIVNSTSENIAVGRRPALHAQLKSAARDRLGSLYNPADYPESLSGLFRVEWDFPNVDAPSYLQQLNPALYAQECRRVAARFDEAVQLAEEAFLAELTGLVTHLTERLTGQNDGKPKVFRDSIVNNLTEFFQRFRRLNIRSNEQLELRAVAGLPTEPLAPTAGLQKRPET